MDFGEVKLLLREPSWLSFHLSAVFLKKTYGNLPTPRNLQVNTEEREREIEIHQKMEW